MKKQFSKTIYFQNVEFFVMTVAGSVKSAAERFDCSAHELKKYGFANTRIQIPDDGVVYCRAGYGGETRILFAAYPNEIFDFERAKSVVLQMRKSIPVRNDAAITEWVSKNNIAELIGETFKPITT